MDKELVIIGNGFDLSCGLKSSYNDFFSVRYQEFDRSNFKGNFAEIIKFRIKIDEISNLILIETNELNSLKQNIYLSQLADMYTSKISQLEQEIQNKNKELDNVKRDLYSSINQMIFSEELTFWDYVFMFKSNVNNEDILWCNIEAEILSVLNDLLASFQDISVNESLDYLLYRNHLSILLFAYLRSNKFSNIFDDKIKCETLLLKYKCSNLYEFLLIELNNFEVGFNSYIRENIAQNKQSYGDKANRLFRNIFSQNTEVYLLNFNYTDPLNYLNNHSVYHTNNVHGDIYSSEVIFGIDGFSELDDNLKIFTKTNRVISMPHKEIESIPVKEITKNISFFGHSLSEADYSYFLSVFDYYDIYNSDIKLTFFYKNFCSTAKKEMIKNISDLMKRYGESFDNHAKGKNLMHKLLLEKRLAVRKIN